jgi:GT2 family glycosyltransferase
MDQLDAKIARVSIVVPARNESDAILFCLDGFAKQTWPKSRLEVIVADGQSTDDTQSKVATFAADHQWVKIVTNPKQRASAAFNLGISHATGDVICLFSAHGIPAIDYVAKCVEVLCETNAAGVGGPLSPAPSATPQSRAIGAAVHSPFGMASRFRFSRGRAEVDTIGHPAYRRDAVEATGRFDESLERNSDFEFNWRMRRAGFRLILDPKIQSAYQARADLRSLARQYWDYGRWKAEVVHSHPASIRPRQLVPPVFAAWLALGPLALVCRRYRRLAAVSVGTYAVAVAVATTASVQDERDSDLSIPTVMAAFPVMHLSWGYGFLSWFVRRPQRMNSGALDADDWMPPQE